MVKLDYQPAESITDLHVQRGAEAANITSKIRLFFCAAESHLHGSILSHNTDKKIIIQVSE